MIAACVTTSYMYMYMYIHVGELSDTCWSIVWGLAVVGTIQFCVGYMYKQYWTAIGNGDHSN